jgi:hypothetical protein
MVGGAVRDGGVVPVKVQNAIRFRFELHLPDFVLHPLTAVVIAAAHVYLAAGHLSDLAVGDVEWTHFWKGFGALAGAYVFAALASHGLAENRRSVRSPVPAGA